MRYSDSNLPEGDWNDYRKMTITRCIKMHEDFEVVTIDGNLARGKAGDYLCVDSQGHPYPCNGHEFIAIYAPAPPKDTLERDIAVMSHAHHADVRPPRGH